MKLPDGKILMPGVIDRTTDVREHPEVIAEQIIRYANVVGRGERDRVLRLRNARASPARLDQGYRAMVEGAERAFAEALEARALEARRPRSAAVRTFASWRSRSVLHGRLPERADEIDAQKWLGSANPQRSATSATSSRLRLVTQYFCARSSRIRNSSCRKRGARIREGAVQGAQRNAMKPGHARRGKPGLVQAVGQRAAE